ncbi:MAG TPA: hypothetical protein VND95_11175 [Stellaceae bacterium]|nr:hypothetical protein [Stellaceae bacterium]
MDMRTYNTVMVVLFLLTGALLFVRLIYDWPSQIGGMAIPLWASFGAVIVTGALAYFGSRREN